MTRYACSHCGNVYIQCTAWVDINTGEVSDDESPTSQIWCHVCEVDCADTAVITEEQYQAAVAKEDLP